MVISATEAHILTVKEYIWYDDVSDIKLYYP